MLNSYLIDKQIRKKVDLLLNTLGYEELRSKVLNYDVPICPELERDMKALLKQHAADVLETSKNTLIQQALADQIVEDAEQERLYEQFDSSSDGALKQRLRDKHALHQRATLDASHSARLTIGQPQFKDSLAQVRFSLEQSNQAFKQYAAMYERSGQMLDAAIARRLRKLQITCNSTDLSKRLSPENFTRLNENLEKLNQDIAADKASLHDGMSHRIYTYFKNVFVVYTLPDSERLALKAIRQKMEAYLAERAKEPGKREELKKYEAHLVYLNSYLQQQKDATARNTSNRDVLTVKKSHLQTRRFIYKSLALISTALLAAAVLWGALLLFGVTLPAAVAFVGVYTLLLSIVITGISAMSFGLLRLIASSNLNQVTQELVAVEKNITTSVNEEKRMPDVLKAQGDIISATKEALNQIVLNKTRYLEEAKAIKPDVKPAVSLGTNPFTQFNGVGAASNTVVYSTEQPPNPP